MAHQIDSSNNRANMAYSGEKPWHGLGFQIDADASIQAWRTAAGLDWEIKKGGMVMRTEDGALVDASDLNRSILYRNDTQARLSVMSTNGFHVVQPDQILSFIGDSVRAMGWKMETAGSLKGGRKIWALANIGESAMIGTGDKVKGYLLAATACDGSMASEFMFTSVRVVCNNTLHMAVEGSLKQRDNEQPRVKVYHYNTLDVDAVKKQLGIAGTVWSQFIERAKALSRINLSEKKAVRILRSVYTPEEKVVDGEVISDEQFLKENTTARRVLELYQGAGIGMQLKTSRDTAWGLVNATTEFYDHASKTRSIDNRMNSAWFGAGAAKKQEVFDACFELAA
jgi:phage/plasmid-like protein (TIGR03299 family)